MVRYQNSEMIKYSQRKPTSYMSLIVRHKYLLKQFLVNIDSFGGCWTWHP